MEILIYYPTIISCTYGAAQKRQIQKWDPEEAQWKNNVRPQIQTPLLKQLRRLLPNFIKMAAIFIEPNTHRALGGSQVLPQHSGKRSLFIRTHYQLNPPPHKSIECTFRHFVRPSILDPLFQISPESFGKREGEKFLVNKILHKIAELGISLFGILRDLYEKIQFEPRRNIRSCVNRSNQKGVYRVLEFACWAEDP